MIMFNSLSLSVPAFLIEWGVDERVKKGECWSKLRGNDVRIMHRDYRPEPFFYENGGKKICVIGSPIYKDKIDKANLCIDFINNHNNKEWLQTINGEFLIILLNKERSNLIVVNSRFTSPPFWYYAEEGKFIGSFSYNDLFLRLKEIEKLMVTYEGFLDLLIYKRVFGHKTHDKYSLLMQPASILKIDAQSSSLTRYWEPNFTQKTSRSLEDCAHTLQERIINSIRNKTADNKRYGLFLSGGMDTRVILAAFSKLNMHPPCFTINQHENREVQVAKKVAKMTGSKHYYLPFKEKHYEKSLLPALKISGAMQLPMCMFLGFEKEISKHIDVAFHGHGFDYFFQGMYLNGKPLMVFGHLLEFRRLREIPDDLVTFFMENISYRTKGGDPWSFIRPEHKQSIWERLYSELSSIKKQAEKYCDTPYDILEYMTFYNLSRHYTFGDHWGINTNVEQRTISFDNDLYHLYQSLPAKYRFDARVQRKCLELLSAPLANLISANSTYPIKSSCTIRTYYQLKNKLLRAFKLKEEDTSNNDFERMGLPLDYVLRRDFRSLAEELLVSDRLSDVPYLDLDIIRKQTKEWLDSETGGGQVLMSLITIDQFLKQLEN